MDEQYKVGIYEPKVKPVRSKIKPKSRVSAPLSWFRQVRLYAPINPNYRRLSIPVAMFTWRPPRTFSTSDPHKMALVGWLVGNRGRIFIQCIEQSINTVPVRALSRTNYINAAHLSNSSS